MDDTDTARTTDPAASLAGALADAGLTFERVQILAPREIAVVHCRDELDAWRVMRHLADASIAGSITDPNDVHRWATVEALEDRRSPARWRVVIGTEQRTGKGRA